MIAGTWQGGLRQQPQELAWPRQPLRAEVTVTMRIILDPLRGPYEVRSLNAEVLGKKQV